MNKLKTAAVLAMLAGAALTLFAFIAIMLIADAEGIQL